MNRASETCKFTSIYNVETEKGVERIFLEIMAENFKSLMRNMTLGIQEAQ